MLDRGDLIFRDALVRWIGLQLHGDDKQDGLLRTALSAQDWDAFNRTKGVVQGYENVLRAMDEIIRRMNGDDERPPLRRVMT